MLRKAALILLMIQLASCSVFFKKKTERVLARVNDEYLYESELKGLVLSGTSAEDSIAVVRDYIDTWIRKKLLLNQAKNNLPESELDFTDQLAEYENSLVIYAYEKALVEQKLDTLVGDEEIEAYYHDNIGNFLLKENILKFRYVKLPAGSSQAAQVKRLLDADDPSSLTRLSELCEKEAADYFLDSENWFSFSDVMKEIPVRSSNEEEFIRSNRNFEYHDSAFVYIIRIRDFRIKDNISPIEYEKGRIRNIILNKRKMDLINEMHQAVYQSAQKRNDFEIF